MAKMLSRIITAAGTCLFVGGAPLTGAAQTEPDATTVVVQPVAPPRALLRIGERTGSMRLRDAGGLAAPDPVSNGVRNGAIIGAVGGTIFGVVAARSCEHRDCQVAVPLIWAGIGAGCGALLGLAIDRAIRTDSSTRRRLSAVVAPVLSPKRSGLDVALRW